MKIIFLLLILTTILSFDCSQKTKPEGTVVTISLPKKTYKVYEPIELKYEWINYKDTPDTVTALFVSSAYIQQFISDENGNIYRTNEREPDAMYGRGTVILKNDTLKKTVTLNNYGKEYVQNILTEGYYFHVRYLPAGRYKVHSVVDRDVIKVYTVPIKTNEVEFEVTEPDNTDKEILELAKKERYEEALQLYPDNYFEEHLMYYNIQKYNRDLFIEGEMNNRYKDTSLLPSRYKIFFDKYPNSPYNLQSMFIIQYLRVSTRDSAGAQVKMNELLEKYPVTTISTAVRDIMKTERRTVGV